MVENTIIAILTGKEAIAAYIAIAGTIVSVITFLFERKRFRFNITEPNSNFLYTTVIFTKLQ
jgi:hypothetical protein